jgi:hypothetical protein
MTGKKPDYFVEKSSIVREIWGKADNILFIFAGASAEFALNRSVDWLYYTGRLPADPLGRLFSTVGYAQRIIFSEREEALRSIDQIAAIHKSVEISRGTTIPAEAYIEVLFMLIDYSIRSCQLLERTLSAEEKAAVFDVFYRVGLRMGLDGLPRTYGGYLLMREDQLARGIQKSAFTTDLFMQYRKHLGASRYWLLKQAQVLVVPERVNDLLGHGQTRFLGPVLSVYKFARVFHLQNVLRNGILPRAYAEQVRALDNKG